MALNKEMQIMKNHNSEHENDGDIAGGGGEDDEVPGGDADQGDGAASGDQTTILQTDFGSRDRMQ